MAEAERTALAQEHLNDPNYDVEDSLKRSSSERLRNASSAVSNHPGSSIRRRANAGPAPPLSPSLSTSAAAEQPTTPGTFPLISAVHQLHQFPPQQSYLPTTKPVNNRHLHPPPIASGSQGHSTSFDNPIIPRVNIQSPKSDEPDEYDLESIAGTSTSRRISRDSYGYEKKGGARDYDDMEMDTRSDLEFEDDIEDDSPYPEVRAAVANTDDVSMPTNTFRMWLLGMLFTVLISGLNQFFSMRYPSVQITALVAQLLALPAGKICERIFTARYFTITLPNFPKRNGCWTHRYRFTLNPGPFNVKEHTLITVMANVVAGGAYATDIIAAQRIFYHQHWSAAYQLTLVISTQMIGFSLAGVCRRFLVWPSSMIWPATLVNTALFNTLHSTYGRPEQGHMSRERFFFLAFLGSFIWYFVPGYLFTALSVFNWVCWIWPNSGTVNNLFGYNHGLGMGFITFDWAMIAYIGSPLVTPWWAEANVFASLILVFWILAPILYFKNVFFSQYMPISAPWSYDNTGKVYDAARVIIDGQFNAEAFREYSPLYIPTTFALSYGLSFASLMAITVHTFLWYRHDIARQFKSSLRDETDIHARLMQAYPEVPQWWYVCMGVAAFILGIITIEVWDTNLPIWAYLISLLIAVMYLVPVGMLQAITNQQIGLNVITELIVGYFLPGKPIAMMIFKTFGYITMAQALAFVSDLKLGHYMKIPPRLMFLAQTIATFVSCFVVVGVQAWMFENIPGMCQQNNTDRFTCPQARVFGTASLIWGGIGPQRIFSPGQLYYPLLFFFLIGAILPIPFYYCSRQWPQSLFKYVNLPVFMNGTMLMPPATGINYSSWAMTGFVFQYWIRRRHFKWWSRYNYILSAALDSGVAVGSIVIFFCLQYPNSGGFDLRWWGNTVNDKTLDYRAMAYIPPDQPSGTFGLRTWS
ncbi:putative isp4-oligopeptide transporter [Serendipita vermifera]|nr:putative isp4-oligopeptide transporter [Serendipita vermifera]